MPPVKTLVFIDLATTGFPSEEYYQTRITEMSMLAVSKEHFMALKDKNDVPRVQQKLSLCFNPEKEVTMEARKVSGLNSNLLNSQKRFSEHFPTIRCFLENLEAPIVLISHYGDHMDFPLLQKEIRLAKVTLPAQTLCLDTYPLFNSNSKFEKLLAEYIPTTRFGAQFSPKFDLKTHVYDRYFHHEAPANTTLHPALHTAEGDVFYLFKCTVATKDKFLELVETNAQPFSQINSI